MDWDQNKGKWEGIKVAVHDQWAALTSDEIAIGFGIWHRLLGPIQEHCGTCQETAERQVRAFAARH